PAHHALVVLLDQGLALFVEDALAPQAAAPCLPRLAALGLGLLDRVVGQVHVGKAAGPLRQAGALGCALLRPQRQLLAFAPHVVLVAHRVPPSVRAGAAGVKPWWAERRAITRPPGPLRVAACGRCRRTNRPE